jgi:hypothetical protein
MIFSRLRPKTICLFLAALIILQSCKAYHKKPVTMEEAVASHKKVMITRTNGEKVRLTRIEGENAVYYGILHKSAGIVKIPLETKDISKIQLRDQTRSTIGTILIIFGALVVIILTAGAISLSNADYY